MNIIVIGSGISGMAAAAELAKQGHQVKILEKLSGPGGRMRIIEENGFRFDMGPSWYWMPDIFESFYNKFGYTTEDFYKLHKLDPSYKVWFENDVIDIPNGREAVAELFESLEEGSSKALDKYLDAAKMKYEVGMKKLAYKEGMISDFMKWETISKSLSLDLLNNMRSYVSGYFKDDRIKMLMEFPVLFLGAHPSKIPALYSLMNHADIDLGTWYPEGGMYSVTEAMHRICVEQGVEFQFDTNVKRALIKDKNITGLVCEYEGREEILDTDHVIGAADYHHIEQNIIPESHRKYSNEYWDQRTMAPSCLLYYVGVDKKIDGLEHHNLFFNTDFDKHAHSIYNEPDWPEDPLFYVCAPSKTDIHVAPEGKENLFLLIPVASGIEDTEEVRDRYFNILAEKLKAETGTDIREHLIMRKDFAPKNFVETYNAYRGNAYGLANTLKQTAFLRPSVRNKKIKNISYCGQLTVPGPGLPPALVSGQIAASTVKTSTKKKHEDITTNI